MKRTNREIIISIFVTIMSIVAYLYGFVFADRKNIFLYEHLGSKPFDQITIGRYWMFGFVAAGFICIVLFLILIVQNVASKRRIELNLTSITKYVTIPLLILITVIVTNLGEPTMTFSISISTAFALIFALVIGISFVNDLTTKWLTTLIHLFIGVGLIPFVILFRALELPHKGILSMNKAVSILLITLMLGIIWVIITKWLFRKKEIREILILKGIVAICCLGLPVTHYLMTVVEGHPYITSSDNFFADNIFLRLINWVLIIFIIIGIKKIKFNEKTSG